jgi:hypothetical protein
VLQRQLNRTDRFSLVSKATDCENRRRLEYQRLINLQNFLSEQGVILPEKSVLDVGRCQLDPVWRGVIDLKDKTANPSMMMTKPSISWTCEPFTCSLEADLPVPYAKRHEFKKELEFFDSACAPGEVHIHEDAVAPEAHVHLVCKGIVPSNLGATVSRLARKTMRYRGHNITDTPIG